MIVHRTQLSTPTAYDPIPAHSSNVSGFDQTIAHDYQHLPWSYGTQDGAGTAVNTTSGAAYPENIFPYNQAGNSSGADKHDGYYSEMRPAHRSLHFTNSANSAPSDAAQLAKMTPIDYSFNGGNPFTSMHSIANFGNQLMTSNATYGNVNDGSVSLAIPAQNDWALSNQHRTTGSDDYSYYASPDDFNIAPHFNYNNPHGMSSAPTNDLAYASTPLQLQAYGQNTAEQKHQSHPTMGTSSQFPQPDSFSASYGNTSNLVQPTPFLSGQQFTNDPDYRLSSSPDHPLAMGLDHHAHLPRSQHTPVPISRYSTYSELSANVMYISRTASARAKAQAPLLGSSESRHERRTASRMSPVLRGWSPSSRSRRQKSASVQPASSSSSSSPSPSSSSLPSEYVIRGNQPNFIRVLPRSEPEPTPPQLSGSDMAEKPAQKKGTEKKQTLACLFCRERKIACGRPPEGSADLTCNQCARRSFKCEYPTESRRGQHKRGRKRKDSDDGN